MSSTAVGPTTPPWAPEGISLARAPEPARGSGEHGLDPGVSRNPDGARLLVTRADKDPGSGSWLVSLGRGRPLEPHLSSLEKGRGSSPAAW